MSGSGEMTLAADFRAVLWDVEWYSYLFFIRIHFCDGMGLLKFG